jgi:tripartite-type tricarboxylate transporter receptor subunit TctC
MKRRYAIEPLCLTAAIAALVGLFSATRVGAQDGVADFFKGKQVSIIVGSSAGGGYDTYARLIARHLGNHIPGNPGVVVQNMPGAGSNKATGYVYTVAPKDGTVMGAVFPGVILDPLIGDAHVQHDPNKLVYVGSANSDVYICMLRTDAPAKTFKDAFTHQVILGASNTGGTTRDLPAMLNNLLGTKFKVVSGYAGSKEINLAMERNEVQGSCGIGWTGLTTMHPDWFSKKLISVVAQASMKGHPELNKMGVPLTVSFAKDDEQRQVMELIESQGTFGRPYVLPPGVPAERVKALRKAFMDALHDSALLADASKMQLDLDAMSGEDLQALVAKLYAMPANVVQHAKQALIYKPPT